MNFDKNILSAVRSEGYESPTSVQMQAILFVLEGRDIVASAQTDSGKTAALLLPALQRLTKHSEKPDKGPRALVLTPTRELAARVEKSALAYAKNMRWLRIVSIVDDTSFSYQARVLNKPADLIVTAPGRLMDLMQSGEVGFGRLEVLTLDEADRMLDMGFIDDIETIIEATPSGRQILSFSATWNGTVGKLARRLTKNPEIIEVERMDDQDRIEKQLLYYDGMHHKNRLLDHVLRSVNIDQCVIFTSTRVMTKVITDGLYEKGFAANYLHGDMPQDWYNRTLMDLREGRCKILVAADVTACGIDAPTIAHVINYDLPKQAEDYVRRISRTGRVGRTDVAVTFAEASECVKVHKIREYIDHKLTKLTVEDMKPTRKCKSTGSKPKGKGGQGNGKKTGFEAKGSGFKKGGGEFKARCRSGGGSGGKSGFDKASRPAKR